MQLKFLTRIFMGKLFEIMASDAVFIYLYCVNDFIKIYLFYNYVRDILFS